MGHEITNSAQIDLETRTQQDEMKIRIQVWWLLVWFPATSQIPVSPLSSLVQILNCLFPPGKEYQHLLAPHRRNTQVSHPAPWHLSFPGVTTQIAAQAL